ncbi:MAG: hypothetical protein WBP10_16015 [Thermoanaerobaculia bacterium]|jgi:hypothetical protein
MIWRKLEKTGLVLLAALVGTVGFLVVGARAEVDEDPVDKRVLSQLSDQEIETILREGRVVERKNLDVGVTLGERLWLEHDGYRMSAAFKHLDFERKGLTRFENAPPELNFKDSYRYERAAYLLDRLLGLGMVPVTVLRTVQAHEGAVVAWVEDAITEQERLRLKLAPEDTRLLIRQRAAMRLFDALVYNNDNNLGNQLWTRPDWRLHLIDHTRSFRQRKSLPEDFSKRPVSLTPELYDVLRSLDEAQIRAALGKVLSPGEIKSVLARHKLILEKIEKDRREVGDPFVFLGMTPLPDS